MIFLDTDICIDILNGNQQSENLLDIYKTKQFGITTPSIFELYHGIYKLQYLKRDLAPQKFEKLKNDLTSFIKKLNIFPLNEKSADISAKIHMQLKGEGKEVDVFDCLIAGIILANGFNKILTHNTEHFERIPGLTIV